MLLTKHYKQRLTDLENTVFNLIMLNRESHDQITAHLKRLNEELDEILKVLKAHETKNS